MDSSEIAQEPSLTPSQNANAYIEHPPLRFTASGCSAVMYDDGTRQILVTYHNKVQAWSVRPPPANQGLPHVSFISEGPILSARFSLDRKILSIQRSFQELELVSRDSGAWRLKCRQGTNQRILGFFWVECPSFNLVLVTPTGLELHKVDLPAGGLKLVEFRRMSISWYLYTHESRLAVFASGPQCRTLTCLQFPQNGIVSVPAFKVQLAKEGRALNPVLTAEDVRIGLMYDQVYVLVVDCVGLRVQLFSLFNDEVKPGGCLRIYSPNVAFSFVDSLLLVHQTDLKVVHIFDVKADTASPVAVPASLAVIHSPLDPSPDSWPNGPPASLYDPSWLFLHPDLILDLRSSAIWRVHVDLASLSDSCPDDRLPLIGFLQRRKVNASLARELTIGALQSLALPPGGGTPSVPQTVAALGIVSATYSRKQKVRAGFNSRRPAVLPVDVRVLALASIGPGPGFPAAAMAASQAMTWQEQERVRRQEEASRNSVEVEETEETRKALEPAVSPSEVTDRVLLPMVSERKLSPEVLVGTLIGYLQCLWAKSLHIPLKLQLLVVKLLLDENRHRQLWELIKANVIMDSPDIALLLTNKRNPFSPLRNVGFAMLENLREHEAYMEALLEGGDVIGALKYARQHKVLDFDPKLFLEAALQSREPLLLCAVIRFCCDFVPEFVDSSVYKTYVRASVGLLKL